MQVDLGKGVKIGYQMRGQGAPLFLVMGFGATMDLWSASFLEHLSQRYQLILFDNRGIGTSTAAGGPITIADYAGDTIGLMDKLGIAKAHVLGISMGGMIAQQVAVSYPDRVDKLILGATTCASKLVKKDIALLGLALFRVFPAFALRTMISQEFLQNHPDTVQQLQAYAKRNPTNWTNFRLQSAAVRAYDLADKIKNIKSPTLVLAGTGDRIINHENSDIIASRIPGAKLIKFPGVGHFFPLERPKETTAAIFEFLAEKSS